MTPNNQTRAAAASDEICGCIEDIGCNHREEAVAAIIARHFDESALRAAAQAVLGEVDWMSNYVVIPNPTKAKIEALRAALSVEPSEGNK